MAWQLRAAEPVRGFELRQPADVAMPAGMGLGTRVGGDIPSVLPDRVVEGGVSGVAGEKAIDDRRGTTEAVRDNVAAAGYLGGLPTRRRVLGVGNANLGAASFLPEDCNEPAAPLAVDFTE